MPWGCCVVVVAARTQEHPSMFDLILTRATTLDETPFFPVVTGQGMFEGGALCRAQDYIEVGSICWVEIKAQPTTMSAAAYAPVCATGQGASGHDTACTLAGGRHGALATSLLPKPEPPQQQPLFLRGSGKKEKRAAGDPPLKSFSAFLFFQNPQLFN